MSDLLGAAAVAGSTTCIVAAMHYGRALHRTIVHTRLTTNPHEFAMLEKTAQRPRPAKKPTPPIPFGL